VLLVLAVHDEIVVECGVGQAVAVRDWLKRAMADALAVLIDPVPVGEVEVQVAETWGGPRPDAPPPPPDLPPGPPDSPTPPAPAPSAVPSEPVAGSAAAGEPAAPTAAAAGPSAPPPPTAGTVTPPPAPPLYPDVAGVVAGTRRWAAVRADCLDLLAALPADSVDLCLFSPPYEWARLYLEDGEDLGIAKDTETWVRWLAEVVRGCLRVCKGLVACVVAGQTRDYSYSCGPELLMADLRRAGVTLRRPIIWRRVGIPGSGGPDWLRADTEYIVCAMRGGRLPWSDPTAMGRPCKYAPGGAMSYRNAEGQRHHAPHTPGHKRKHTKRKPDGSMEEQRYVPPKLANPGNVVQQVYTAEAVADLLARYERGDVIDIPVGGALRTRRPDPLAALPRYRLDLNVWGGYEQFDWSRFAAPFWEQSRRHLSGMFESGVWAHLVATRLVVLLVVHCS
jgi:hypothetical protein